MEYIEKDPLPQVCLDCQEYKECLAQGMCEACCDECDHLMERFVDPGDTDFEYKMKLYRLRRALRDLGIER